MLTKNYLARQGFVSECYRTGDVGLTKATHVIHAHALRTTLIPQTLDRIHGLVRRPTSRVDESEEEDHGDLGASGDAGLRGGLTVWSIDDVGSVQGRHNSEQHDDDRR